MTQQYDPRTEWAWDETELRDRANAAETDLASLLDADFDDPALRRLVRETLEAAHQRGDDIDRQTDSVMAVIRVTMRLQLAAAVQDR